MYSIVFYRVIVGWLALGSLLGLSGCAVYDSVFHPHRLGTPAMTPEAKAKLRAAEKARHKGLTLTNPDADATPSADGAAPSTSPVSTSVSNSKAYSELPAGTRATYDKQGLLKKSPLVRLQQNSNKLHHYDLSALPHTAATRDERKMRKHSKNPGKRGAEPRAPAEPTEPAPAPDPTQPAPAPAANASKTPPPRSAAKAPAPRPAKATPKPRTAPRATPTTAPADEPTPTQAAPEKPAKEKKAKKAPKAPKPDPTQPPGSGN